MEWPVRAGRIFLPFLALGVMLEERYSIHRIVLMAFVMMK
jgi:hypothetical protein